MIEIELPWPDKRLSPNARVHWATKAKATKAARWIAFGKLLARKVELKRDLLSVNVHYTFVPKDKRRRDLDNLIACTKAYTDGIAQGLGIDDSKFRLSYEIGAIESTAKMKVSISWQTLDIARSVMHMGDSEI